MKIPSTLAVIVLILANTSSAIEQAVKEKYIRLRQEVETNAFAFLKLDDYQYLADPPSLSLSDAVAKAEAFVRKEKIDMTNRYMCAVKLDFVGPQLQPEWCVMYRKPGSIPADDSLVVMVPMMAAPYRWESVAKENVQSKRSSGR